MKVKSGWGHSHSCRTGSQFYSASESRIISGTGPIKLQVETHSVVFILYIFATEIRNHSMATIYLSKPQEKNGEILKWSHRKNLLPGCHMPVCGWKRVKAKRGKSIYIWIDKMSPLEKQSHSDLSYFPTWKKAQGSHKKLHLIQHKPTWTEKINCAFPGKEAKEFRHVNNVPQQLVKPFKQQTSVFAGLCWSLAMPDLCWINSLSVPKLLHVKSQMVLIIKTYFKLRNDRVKLSLTLKCSKAASSLFHIKKPFEEVHSSEDHL